MVYCTLKEKHIASYSRSTDSGIRQDKRKPQNNYQEGWNMRAYERDDVKIPKRYKKMSIEQLEKKSRITLKIFKMCPQTQREKD